MAGDLIELGEQALVAVTSGVATGAPVVHCQLLASPFYEALKHELRESSQADSAERNRLLAAAGQCRRVAVPSISPDTLLGELRTAVAILQPGGHSPQTRPVRSRPVLRVIEGGLSKRR